MEKLQLANYGLAEMNEKEMLEADGGIFGIDDLILVGIGVAAAFVVNAIYDMGKNDGAKNKNK